MKKPLCLFAAVLMLFAAIAFAGCAPGNTESATPAPTESGSIQRETFMKPGENYRVLFWSTFRENMPLEPGQPGSVQLNEKVDYLKDKYGITVTYVQATDNWLEDAKMTASAGEPICDVLHVGQPGAIPGLYAYNGIAGSIVESITEHGMEDYFSDTQYWNVESTQACGVYNGNLYFVVPNQIGYASAGYNQVTFFNFDMLAKAGYTKEMMYELSDNGEWTFDKLREVCVALTDADRDVYGMCMGATSIAMCSMVTSNDGSFLKKVDGVDRFSATDNKVLTAVDFFVKMAAQDKSVYLGNYIEEEIKGFNVGKYGIMLTYANRAQQLNDLKSEVEFGLIMPPKGPDAQDYISEVNWYDAYCTVKNTPNPKGSIELMSHIIAPPYAKDSTENMVLLEAEAGACLYDEQSIENLVKVRDKSRTTTYQTYCWLSSSDTGFGFGNAILYCCLDFINGSVTPEVYFESVTDAANNIIDQYCSTKE